MPRSALAIRCLLLLVLALFAVPSPVRAEQGAAAELAPGQVSDRRPGRTAKAARVRLWRELARVQAAELDSLAALTSSSPEEAGRRHLEIEAAKQRHARQEIELQRSLAVRDGNAALVRRLDTRLARLAAVTGGAR